MHRAPANKKSGASPLPASISMDRASRHRTPETLSGQHPLCTCASSCPCTSSCRPRKEGFRFQASSHDLPSSKIYAAQYTSEALRCQIFQPSVALSAQRAEAPVGSQRKVTLKGSEQMSSLVFHCSELASSLFLERAISEVVWNGFVKFHGLVLFVLCNFLQGDITTDRRQTSP